METIPEALAYDDVLLVPDFAEVLPADIDISTKLSRNIPLNVPLCSSAMDKVTHYELAIQMALLGGIGILDRNMPIHTQCNHVAKVKRHMTKVIKDPFTLSPDHTIAEARNLMRNESISGIPIIDHPSGRLMGIVTKHDLQYALNKRNTDPISDIMTKENLITAPGTVSVQEAQHLFCSARVEKLLLVDADFRLQGLMTIKDMTKRDKFPRASLCERRGQLLVGAAVGADPKSDFFERAQALCDAGADVIVVDVAHGHSKNAGLALDRLKTLSGVDIIAGNIATAKGARFLFDHGADAVKVGIGPGSICTTRIVTGAGVPQFSAIRMVREELGDLIPIIADGGIRYSGDIPKAIAAGASSVMIGSLFAGTEESPGEKILHGGRTYKSYRGMGSSAVLNSGGDRYGSAKGAPEGIEGMVPYKGPLSLIFGLLIDGLRQGMGYAGCASIKELQTRASFVRITDAGRREGHPHDVTITNEAPNYQIS